MTPNELASVATVVMVVVAYFKMYCFKEPQHTSVLTGAQYYKEMMATRSEPRFFEVARMPRDTFVHFLNLLETELPNILCYCFYCCTPRHHTHFPSSSLCNLTYNSTIFLITILIRII